MADLSRLTEAQQLERARIALTNALSGPPELRAILAERGYDATRITEGSALLTAAEAAVAQQSGAGADRNEATGTKDAALRAALAAWGDIADTVRATFYGDKTTQALFGVAGVSPRKPAALLARADVFFAGLVAHAEHVPALERNGLSAARRQQHRAAFDTLAAEQAEQARVTGAARHATDSQNAALAELNAWLAPFERLARRALKGNSGYLEMLGFGPSTGRTTKRT